ncbi:hypothetical protein FKN01_31840 [Streptomyces sp. 130]|uniref:hypothetical protein n=1 Tax=Streptomyces sp. 130 TaxID=2591006 RepID=UPI00117C25C6|nr:hypothetical protein [Streptomyces sp. 130]TRV71439.1 hypothetical protein FKN01_31840 [Streptomyces sp. 130]
MIRLPTSHAAITAPLVASTTTFPGILIGRSLLDGRPVHLSPVLTPTALLPATNSLALGGIGSGKSTTGKVRARREIRDHGHQYVVIDSFGEDSTGEWGALTRAMGGQVIEAGTFALNACSTMLPREVREQLLRSLVAAVEPGALTYQSTHALQHALNDPKAVNLTGLVDALLRPEDGRWPAVKLADWGEGVAIALSRYTEGSLRGIFDRPDATLPPTDLPILTFDLSALDRSSPAIPALMAAVTVWVEHVWLRQSTAVHRHLVLEEAWQILLSPATAELIQRLLKNSRKSGLSLDVLMHTLSDLGGGRAQDLARLCEVAHIGRLNPEEAAAVGALYGLPDWAVAMIPHLDPGQAVWRIGPHHVDVVETIRDADEVHLTDTSVRRRAAQEALTVREDDVQERDVPDVQEHQDQGHGQSVPGGLWDSRHYDAIEAARQGRYTEAADLAALGERQDITAYGIMSDQASAWLSTRAKVAELSGSSATAARLRATVGRMGKQVEWWDEKPADPGYAGGPVAPAAHESAVTAEAPERRRRRAWPAVAAVVVLGLGAVSLWRQALDDQGEQKAEARTTAGAAEAAYKGVSAADVVIDGVTAETLASWTRDGSAVILSVTVDSDQPARTVRIASGDQTAREDVEPASEGQIPMPVQLEVRVPVKDRTEAVTLSVAVGGADWTKGTEPPRRTIEYRPDRTARDVDTGEWLKQQYSHL